MSRFNVGDEVIYAGKIADLEGFTGVVKVVYLSSHQPGVFEYTIAWDDCYRKDILYLLPEEALRLKPTQGKADTAARYETKDSGKRQDYESGMQRDTQEGKPRFDLIFADDLPYSKQMLTRFAGLMERGASKYGERNWQLSNSAEELARFKASATRHFMQWIMGETDEDHGAAVYFNIMAAERLLNRLAEGK